jgi:hypothetical protein
LTWRTVEDIVVTDMRSLMGFYFTDDCQGPGGGTIASTLETLENIMIEVVVVMAGNMGDMIGEMAGSMGDSGMTLNPALVVQITEITDIVAEQVPPVISDGFAVIGCARISEAYYQIKSPICCDVVVSMYWVACESLLSSHLLLDRYGLTRAPYCSCSPRPPSPALPWCLRSALRHGLLHAHRDDPNDRFERQGIPRHRARKPEKEGAGR